MDELRALEQRVQKRLRELAPKVAEYRDLEKVAERLGIKREPLPEPPDTEPAKPAAKRKPKPPRSAARKPRATGTRAAKRAASGGASTSARDGASTDGAWPPPRSRTASRKRAAKAGPRP